MRGRDQINCGPGVVPTRIAGRLITLVLGGARSGKSSVAEGLAGRSGRPVTYIATAVADPDDASMAERISEHRRRRPGSWATVEIRSSDDLVPALGLVSGTVLIDSVGTWLACAPGFAVDTPALCSAMRERSGETVIVSEEVGMGVHPATESGRDFRDALGLVNQAISARADEVLLVVAGRVLRLDRPA